MQTLILQQMERWTNPKMTRLLMLSMMVAMATAATVPVETDFDDDSSTYQGELDDLSLSIKVTHPEEQLPDSKVKVTKPYDPRTPYISRSYHTRDSHHPPRPSQTRRDLNLLTPAPHSRSRSQEQSRNIDRGQTGNPTFSDLDLSEATTLDDLDLTKAASGTLDDLDVAEDSGLDIPDGKAELKSLVQGLQDQLKESQSLQVAARSILNVVQERQSALEEDLSFLKNEISSLHRLQTKDREAVKALKDIISDNTWGITTLVTSQEHLKKDVQHLKQGKENSNSTMHRLEEAVLVGAQRDENLQEGLQGLRKEVTNLRTDWSEDHEIILDLREVLRGKFGDLDLLKSDRHHSRRHGHNHLHSIVDVEIEPSNSINPDSDNQGGSHGNHVSVGPERAQQKVTNNLATSFEGENNVVENDLEELTRMESKLRQDMEQFSQKFSLYDTEITRVYAMFYNLSFQMSTLENKLLQHQQKHYDSNLVDLQQSLLNFTHHLYGMEQTRSSHAPANSTVSTPQDLQLLNNIINNHQGRIETMERISHQHIANQEQVNDFMTMQMSRMNNSIGRFYKSFQDHHIEATDVFDFIEEKFMEFNRRIQTNDDRLLQMEVRVLNTSLARCERQSQTLFQEKKLEDVDKVTSILSQQVEGHNDLLDRLDHGMSRMFDDLGKQTQIVGTVVSEVKMLSDVVPQVVVLQHEVNNLLLHLPTDCTAVGEQESQPQDGPYLIRPQDGTTSADTFCEFQQGGDTYTVIQRREDGSVSFARDWDDYKFGFGSAAGEFWIGNENLHRITTQGDYGIRIEMWDLQDRFWWAEYQEFRVDEEEDNYRLHIGDYSGNATDALQYSNYMTFSTIDRDNDASSTHCARFYTSGWWYKHCHYGNLNGRYTVGVVWFNHDFDEWVQLRKTVMKIKRVERSSKNNTKTPKQRENETSDSKFMEYYQSNT